MNVDFRTWAFFWTVFQAGLPGVVAGLLIPVRTVFLLFTESDALVDCVRARAGEFKPGNSMELIKFSLLGALTLGAGIPLMKELELLFTYRGAGISAVFLLWGKLLRWLTSFVSRVIFRAISSRFSRLKQSGEASPPVQPPSAAPASLRIRRLSMDVTTTTTTTSTHDHDDDTTTTTV